MARFALAVLVVAAAGCHSEVDSAPSTGGTVGSEPRAIDGDKVRILRSNDPLERACALPGEQLARIWRGHDEVRSEDVTVVPLEPNYWGDFARTSHTGPWDYLQHVPLVFYGSGYIKANGLVDASATLADVYPTLGRLLKVDFPPRAGDLLPDVVKEGVEDVPDLVVGVVWDGAGSNVLARWPDSWPNLRRLQDAGTGYATASVGSSPSITTATHATLATGAYPRAHSVTAIDVRRRNGDIGMMFDGGDPRDMQLTSFGDEFDLVVGNRANVGMVAWQMDSPRPLEPPDAYRSNHIGFLGHGSAIPKGDRDHLLLIDGEGGIVANERWFSVPDYADRSLLQNLARKTDREDGEIDGKWLDSDVLARHDNPAWVRYQIEIVKRLVADKGYGADDIPDLLLINFKPLDLIGHAKTIDSPEMKAILEAHDEALGSLVDFLDQEVSDYALFLTADHGHTRSPVKTGAWPISPTEVVADIDRHFGIDEDDSLTETSSAVGLFLDYATAREHDVAPREIARYLNNYAIRDNVDGNLPGAYEDRGAENAFAAAFAKKQLPAIMRCAFDATRPPADIDA